MGKYDSLIIESPSMQVETALLAQAQKPLELLRSRQQRMNFLKWLSVPVLASIVGVFYFRNQNSMRSNPEHGSEEANLLALLPVDDMESMELIADLDLIESLEDLEAWEES